MLEALDARLLACHHMLLEDLSSELLEDVAWEDLAWPTGFGSSLFGYDSKLATQHFSGLYQDGAADSLCQMGSHYQCQVDPG